MLLSNSRNVFIYDALVTAQHLNQPNLPLSEMVHELESRIRDGKAVWTNTANTEELRIREASLSEDVLTMLVQFTTTDASDPAFGEFETGNVRIASREVNEGLTVAAHLVISTSVQNDGYYRAIIEQVPGVGQTVLTKILNKQLKECGRWPIEDDAGNKANSYATISFHGHQSETLRDALKTGRITGVELISRVPNGKKWDPVDDVVEKSHVTKLSLVDESESKLVQTINQIRDYAKKNHADMRVRITRKIDSRRSKTQTVPVDETLKDAMESLFTRSETIRLSKKICQCEEKIHEELSKAMRKLLLETLKGGEEVNGDTEDTPEPA